MGELVPNFDRTARRHEALHPSADEMAGAEARGAKRHTLLIRAAKLCTGAGEYLCVVRDASETGISVLIFHPLQQCNSATIELQNGDRYPVELVWQNAEKAGFCFRETVDIARIIACPSPFDKRPVRIKLTAPAQIEILGEAHFATICDISQQGAKVACDAHIAIDQRLKLLADGMREVFAKVRWRRDGMVGLVFDETFQFAELALVARRLQGQF